jgi:hypothetical protein
MANIYCREGHYDRALEVHKSVLETKTRVCGQDSLVVPKCYGNLGNVLDDMTRAHTHIHLSMHKYICIYEDDLVVCLRARTTGSSIRIDCESARRLSLHRL